MYSNCVLVMYTLIFKNYIFFLFLLNCKVKCYSSVLSAENHIWLNVFFKKKTLIPLPDLKIDITCVNKYINILDIIYTNKRNLIHFIFTESQFKYFNHINLNTNWNYREIYEFFGVKHSKQIDTRNLLLDYSSIQKPLLRSFPCEGLSEIHYNLPNNKLEYLEINYIEL